MNDFGGKLRKAREEGGVSLQQIAARTKIPVAALMALERNDVSKLPGGIFSRAFVKSYALEVGLDPDKTLREFLDRFHPEPVVPEPPPGAAEVPEEESAFESRKQMASVLLKIVVASIVLAGAILYFTLRQSSESSTPPASPAPAADAAASAPPVPGAAPASPPQASEEQALTIEIAPTAACWVSVTVDGKRMFQRVMQPGQREILRILDAAVIDVGDAGAFAFWINGRPGRPLGERGQARIARITHANMSEYIR
jgi:cytoskeletal protein RodZ